MPETCDNGREPFPFFLTPPKLRYTCNENPIRANRARSLPRFALISRSAERRSRVEDGEDAIRGRRHHTRKLHGTVGKSPG